MPSVIGIRPPCTFEEILYAQCEKQWCMRVKYSRKDKTHQLHPTSLEYKVEYVTLQRYQGWKKTLEISSTFKMKCYRTSYRSSEVIFHHFMASSLAILCIIKQTVPQVNSTTMDQIAISTHSYPKNKAMSFYF